MEMGKEICRLVYMKNGVPQECGGEMEEVEVPQPFTMHSRVGGPPDPPLLFYRRCKKCRVVRDLAGERGWRPRTT